MYVCTYTCHRTYVQNNTNESEENLLSGKPRKNNNKFKYYRLTTNKIRTIPVGVLRCDASQ